jgi:hypothetical protein
VTQWARTTSGDIFLPKTTDATPALVTDVGACAQIKIPSVVSFILGEWVFDTSLGNDWMGQVWSQKNPRVPVLKQWLRKIVLGVPTVVEADDVSASYSSALRDFKYNLLARLSTGQVVAVPAPAA